jgi:predicted O-methyltransferase YrrM
MRNTPQFVDDNVLRIGNYRFYCEHPIRGLRPGMLQVEKPRWLVEDYFRVCRELHPRRIVELGVYKGGSTALLSELTEPEKLVALELSQEPVPILTQYIEDRRLTDVISPHYGVDQGDRARVAQIVSAEFGNEPVDLVIDDASHLYDETKSSFETLFPTVRPGGLYILEDWRWRHQAANAFARAPVAKRQAVVAQRMVDIAEGRASLPEPMSRLVLELVLARASDAGAVAELTIGPAWAAVLRGDGPLDPDTFRVADIVHDHFDLLRPIA